MGLNGITSDYCRNRVINATHELTARKCDRAGDRIEIAARELRSGEVTKLFSASFDRDRWARFVRAEFRGNGQFAHEWISEPRETTITDARAYRFEVAEDLAAEIAERCRQRAEEDGYKLDTRCRQWIVFRVQNYTLEALRKLWSAPKKATALK